MTKSDDTSHIHPPARSHQPFQAVVMPVERASTIVFDDLEAFEKRAERVYDVRRREPCLFARVDVHVYRKRGHGVAFLMSGMYTTGAR